MAMASANAASSPSTSPTGPLIPIMLDELHSDSNSVKARSVKKSHVPDASLQANADSGSSLPHQTIVNDVDSLYSATSSLYSIAVRQVSTGHCLIVVNKTFQGRLSKRVANHDYLDRFAGHMRSANITVDTVMDLNRAAMLRKFHDFHSDCLDRNEQSILIVVIVSHGVYGSVYGTDEKPVTIREITEAFSASRKPRLAGIPKIFIIQSCQKFSECQELTSQQQQRLVPNIEQHMLLEYSTLPGQFDFDFRSRGSVYFCQLNKVLDKRMNTSTLIEIFQHTRKKLEEAGGIEYKGDTYRPCSMSQSTLHWPIRFYSLSGTSGLQVVSPIVDENDTKVSHNSIPIGDDVPDTPPPPVPRTRNTVAPPPLPDSPHPDEEASGEHESGYEEPSEILCLPYFFGNHPKEVIKKALKDFRDKPGSFLLRKSSEEGKYTFAIMHENQQLLYMRMSVTTNSGRDLYSLVSTERMFPSIEALVHYYSDHQIPNVENMENVHLKHPVESSLYQPLHQ